MNNHSKSEPPVNRNSPLFRKIVEICGEAPPANSSCLFVPQPIMKKLTNKQHMRSDVGHTLTMILAEWMAGELIVETGTFEDEYEKKIIKILKDSCFINHSPDLDLCTINEDQVLSLLNRLFPEQRKS